MKPFEWITEEYNIRRGAKGVILERMRAAKDHFNGDVAIPLPEMGPNEKPAVANLMAQGLDQTAMRVASVLPNIVVPAMIPGKDSGEGSEDWANRRRMAMNGWWQEAKLNLKMRRMARWVIGYATAPMMIKPNFRTGLPDFVLRDPLSTYAALDVDYDDEQPTDFIYAYQRTYRWLRQHHPEQATALARKFRHTPRDSMILEMIEYIDEEERVLGVVRTRDQSAYGDAIWTPESHFETSTGGIEVARVPNRAGICWGVQSNRINIDRLQGQFDQVFGIYQNQARLMALETIAVEKAVFPDIAITGTTPGRVPVLINGKWQDGRDGEVNVVRDGRVDVIQMNPGFMTEPLIDRHERNIRTSGVPAQFSGQTPTNIATGRLGNQTLSATVDFPIQEYQEILAETLQEANKRAIAIAKSYFGEEKKSFYVDFNGSRGNASYKPNTHFESSAHRVNYSAPGADLNSLVIGIGQRIGIGTMSAYTAMHQDPLVPDAEFEYRKVNSERVQRALMDFVSTQIANGAIDPQDVVLLWEEIEKGANIADAWKKAQEAAQKRQAEAQRAALQAQQEQAAAEAQQGVPPEAAQPGLSPQGPLGAEAGVAIQGPAPSQANLSNLLGALRQPRSLTAPLGGPNSAPRTPVG